MITEGRSIIHMIHQRPAPVAIGGQRVQGDEEPEKSGPVRKVDGEVQQSVSQVSEIGERPRPNLWEFRQRALNLQQGDEESERDVLCQDRQAKRRRAAFHVLMIVAAHG